MSTGNTTPTPWRVCGGATPAYTAISSADGFIVFSMADREMDVVGDGQRIKAPDYETQRANAELIVTAVNSHATLLAVAKALAYWDRKAGDERISEEGELDGLYEICERARDAIAVAETAGRAAKGATTA